MGRESAKGLREPEHRIERKGSGKAEAGGDWERREGKLKMEYLEGNQLVIANLMYSMQKGWIAPVDNLTSINLSHLFNSHFFSPVNINNVFLQIILRHSQGK